MTGTFSAIGRGGAGQAQDSGAPASIVPAFPAICRRRRPGDLGARAARAAACAVLPGLLSVLLAPPALAQSALVSNSGQSTNTHVELESNKSSQRFTAGSHSTGYLLSSIVLDGDFAGYTAGTVTLHSTNRSGAKVADFTASLNSSSHLVLTPTKPTGLASGSEYAILTDTDFNTGDWNSTSSDSEDSGASPGWSIRNTSEVEIGSWTSVSRSFQITVNGQTRAANTEATGQPAISGRANVGQTLTATLGTINDVNGIPSNVDYQWTRYDGSDETEITNATKSTYTLQGADRNHQIAVRISFTDSAGYAESRMSDYYPGSGVVAAALPVHCTPSNARELWCANLTVGSSGGATGYDFSPAFGVLSPAAFLQTDGQAAFVTELAYTGTTLHFRLALDQELREGRYVLEFGTGDNKKRIFVFASGTSRHFTFDDHGLSWTANETVPVKLFVTNAATGKPAITGRPRVGDTLTASPGTIADPDGITGSYSYQWLRVDGGVDNEIMSATSSTYTLTADDQGKKVKVKLSFTDGAGERESRTSDAYPASGNIAMTGACLAPTPTGGATQVWTGTVTVAQEDFIGTTAYGFSEGAFGSLDDKTYTAGSTSYTIDAMYANSVGQLIFSQSAILTSTHKRQLTLWVCDEDSFRLADATLASASFHTYRWNSTGLDWSSHSTRTLYLHHDAAAPTLVSAAVEGTSLVMTFSEDIADSANLSNDGFEVKKAPAGGGAESTVTLSGSPSVSGNTVTLTVPWIPHGETVRVSYERPTSGSSNKLADSVGNLTANFPGQPVTNKNPRLTITIEPNQDTYTGHLDFIHYTLTRTGLTTDAQTVTVTLTPPAGTDWSIPNPNLTHSVTFGAGNDKAKLSIGLRSSGFRTIGFSSSAVVSGTLSAGLSAVSGYDTTDTAETAIVVHSGDLWLVSAELPAGNQFTEEGGAQNITIVVRAAHADMPLPSMHHTNLGIGLAPRVQSEDSGTATGGTDYTVHSSADSIDASEFSRDANGFLVARAQRSVSITQDTAGEGDETIVFSLDRGFGEPSSIGIRGASFTATIRDDDVGIESIEVTSTPTFTSAGASQPDTYGEGSVIELTMNMIGADAEVDTSGGTPHLEFSLGGTDTNALYSAARSTAGKLVFTYTVLAADMDDNGIFLLNTKKTGSDNDDALKLNGATIASAISSGVADLASYEDRGQQDNHKVDGSLSFGLVSARLDGVSLIMTFSEDLDEAATGIPTNAAFAVKVTESGSTTDATLTGAPVVSGSTVTLTLASAPNSGATLTVAYAKPGTGGKLRTSDGTMDLASFAARSVTRNTAATGAPSIFGPTRVGGVLQSGLGTIADVNGVTMATLSRQWYRQDAGGSHRSPIGTGNTYTPTRFDVGMKILVEASFTDDLGFAETRPSAEFPVSGNILPAKACAAPPSQLPSGATQVWTGTVTVGANAGNVLHGYMAGVSAGALSATTFEIGSPAVEYTIDAVNTSTTDTSLSFSLESRDLPAAEKPKLTLWVCGTAYPFDSASAPTAQHTYTLATSGVDWSTEGSLTLYLTRDGTPPALDFATVDGASLEINFDEDLGAAANLANGAFAVKKGSSDLMLDSSSSPSISGKTVTLTLDSGSEVTASDTDIKVSYEKPSSGSDNKLVGTLGNEIANFTDEPVVNLLADSTNPALANTGPAVLAADGLTLTLTYNERLKESSTPDKSAFTVEATPAGGTEATLDLASTDAVEVTGSTVVLKLQEPIAHNDGSVKVTYVVPTGTADRIEDIAGNDAPAFADQAVTNNSTVPRVSIARVHADATPWIAHAEFTVTRSNTDANDALAVDIEVTQADSYLASTSQTITINAGDTQPHPEVLDPAARCGPGARRA